MAYKFIDIRRSIPRHPTRKWSKRTTVSHIVVHTTASDNQDPNKTALYHITPSPDNHISTKGAPGLCYSDFITKDGIVYHCNSYEDITWHAGLFNTRSISVVMAFKGQDGIAPTAAQLIALEEHLTILCLFIKISPANVIGHREIPGMFTVLGNGSRVYKKKCLLPDSRVLMTDGYKRIDEINIGEQVMGPISSTAQLVSDVIINDYQGEIIEIAPMYDCFSPLKCTPDHKILAWKGSGCSLADSRKRKFCNPIACSSKKYSDKTHSCKSESYTASDIAAEVTWVKAQDLKEGSYLALNLGKYDYEPEFSNELAWLAGLYCAEGFQYQNESVVLSFNKKTEYDLVRRAKSVAEQAGFPCLIKEARTALNLIINNRFHRVVSKFVQGTRATNKYLTETFMSTPIEYQDHFVAGFLAGDGCEDKSRIRFSTSSEMLSHQLFILLARLGFNPCKTLGRPRRECVIEGRTVLANQEYAVEAIKNGDSSFALRAGNYFLFPIKKISSFLYEGKVYDITVENDEAFFTNSITVHNCPGMGVNLEDLRYKVTTRLQRRLAAENLYSAKIDGIWGPLSIAALSAFRPELLMTFK